MNGTEITGDIELSGGNLARVSGTLDGALVATDVGDGVITKEDDFEADAPAGYKWDEEGVLVKAGIEVVINPGQPDERTATYDNVAAAVADQSGKSVQQADIGEIQRILTGTGAYIGL